jgi:hypothetical protein
MLDRLTDCDVVCGWRKARQDAFFSRTLPSRIANALISHLSKVYLHDYGCTLRVYRREYIQDIPLYGEMHRFIPIPAAWAGAKVGELVVNHRPRTAGVSKYGIGRTFKVLLDLMTIKLLGSYATKPIYFFGFYGLALLCLGALCGAGVVIIKVADIDWHHTFSLGICCGFLLLLGMQSIMLGLLAELQVRTYHESQQKPIYLIKETVGLAPGGA